MLDRGAVGTAPRFRSPSHEPRSSWGDRFRRRRRRTRNGSSRRAWSSSRHWATPRAARCGWSAGMPEKGGGVARSDVLVIGRSASAITRPRADIRSAPSGRRVMAAVVARWRSRGGRTAEPIPVSDAALERVHAAGYVRSIGSTAGRRVRLDPDTYAAPESEAIERLAAGAAAGGGRSRPRRRRDCPGPRAAAGPPRGARAGHGLLPVQQRGRRRGPRPRSGARAGCRHRLRRAPRKRHAVDLLRRPARALPVDAPVPLLSRHGSGRRRGARRRGGLHRQHPARGGGGRRRHSIASSGRSWSRCWPPTSRS